MNDGIENRPEPDALLTEAKKEGRGKLKIFLGAAPGVGKTYAMLRTGQQRLQEGRDIVAGIVETHSRKETEGILQGLEVLPRRTMEYRGKVFQEMDIDALLARKPDIALVDELAHTNVEGSRHTKRWQDVEELLSNGINVYSTLNIQHLESLNDIVERITTVKVQETLPDSVLKMADEIELIDLPPDDLIQRLREGKVYMPDQAQMAIRHYFSRGNLTALRELSMRAAAEHVDSDLIALMKTQGVSTLWPARERIIVCIDESKNAFDLVRMTSRIAARTRIPWIALHVESAGETLFTEKERDNIDESMRIAEQLGGETITIQGSMNIADDILSFARSRNATRLIIGRSAKSAIGNLIFPSVSRQLILKAQDFDVTLLHRTQEDANEGGYLRFWHNFAGKPALQDFKNPTLAVFITLILSFIVYEVLPAANLSLAFLVPVLYAGVRYGLWPSLYTVALGWACYNFLFTEPRFSFHMQNYQDISTLILFLVVAVITGNLAVRLKKQIEALRDSARRNAQMHDFARKLSSELNLDDILQEVVSSISLDMKMKAVVLMSETATVDTLSVKARFPEEGNEVNLTDWAAAEWAWKSGKPAGAGSDTLPGSHWFFVPLKGPQGVIAVIGTAPKEDITEEYILSSPQRRILFAYCDQAALAIERARLANDIEDTRILSETEKLRTALLSSISHDLRTPLASILGSASSLKELNRSLSAEDRQALVLNIVQESDRLNRFVQNLLDMTKLGHGNLKIKKQWCGDFRDVLSVALNRLNDELKHFKVEFRIDDDVTNLFIDPVLMEQVMVNIFENATKYSPINTRITVSLKRENKKVVLRVADQGQGIPEEDRERVFDMFFRVRAGDTKVAGTGLGLAICRGIIEAMGGTIHAEAGFNKVGTVIVISFPSEMAASKSFYAGQETI